MKFLPFIHEKKFFPTETEAGGSEVNPDHEPFVARGGFVAEMQVCRSVHD